MKSNIRSVKHSIPFAREAREGTLSGDDMMYAYIAQRIKETMNMGLHNLALTHVLSDNVVDYLQNIGYSVTLNVSDYPLDDPAYNTMSISWR
jgi:hypothetical protein